MCRRVPRHHQIQIENVFFQSVCGGGNKLALTQNVFPLMSRQGASRTAEDGERERRTAEERDDRGAPPRGSATRGLPPGPNPPPANRVRHAAEQALSNPASRVLPSGEQPPRVGW